MAKKSDIAVLGSGLFGITVANLLSEKMPPIHLWLPTSKDAERLQTNRIVDTGQFSYRLNEDMEVISGYKRFTKGSWIFFITVSSRRFEDTIEALLQHIDASGSHCFIIMTKGLLSRSARRRHNIYTFSQYVNQIALQKNCHNISIAAVSGPSLLEEIQSYNYSFFQVGCKDSATENFLLESLKNDYINLDFTEDILGVEVVNALKDSIAVASGMIAELPHSGINLQGMLISKGFREMLHFGIRLGAKRATLLGTAGLADLFTTASNPKSRGRNYGLQFTRKIMGKESRLNFLERVQILFRPIRFIEKEMSSGQEVIEGALALAPVLEIAEEKGLKLPLFKTIYSIFVREKAPEELIGLFTDIVETERLNSHSKPVAFQMIAGQAFNQLLKTRILHRIGNKPGVQERIKNQAANTIKRLRRRQKVSRQKKNQREQSSLLRETALWHRIENSPPEKIQTDLEELIALYVKGISDQYHPTVRSTLIRMVAPGRFVIGGVYRGASIPIIGGAIEECKKIARSHSILYVPTHLSHLDSLEVGLGLYWSRLPIPRYAAGSNLMQSRIWSWVLKSLGAYSVDREHSQNFLYLECLSRYSQMLLEAGIPSLVYPEGTRSRNGGIGAIKTGLLSTAIDAYRDSGNDVAVVPLALSYENVPEDLEFSDVKKRTSLRDFIGLRTYAYMNICEPIFVSNHIKEADPTLAIADKINSSWRYNLTVLPNYILAKILTQNAGPIEMAVLEDKVEDFILSYTGNYLTQSTERIISSGIKILQKRGFIRVKGGKVIPLQEACLNYYSNMIPGAPDPIESPDGSSAQPSAD